MKKWPILIVLTLLVLALVPWLIGSQVEARYHQSLQLIQQNVEQNAALELNQTSEYHRGWFGSVATTHFDLVHAEQSIGQLAIKSDISHGPLLFHSQGFVGLAAAASTIEEIAFATVHLQSPDNDLIQVNSLVNFSGTTSAHIEQPLLRGTIDHPERGEMFFEIGPTRGDYQFTRDHDAVSTDVENAFVKVGEGDSMIEVKRIKATSDIERHGERIWLGTSALSAQSMQVIGSHSTSNLPLNITLTAPVVRQSVELHDEDSLKMVVSLSADQLANDQPLANNVELQWRAERIKADAINALLNVVANIDGSEESLPTEAALAAALDALLANDPHLTLERLQAETPWGPIEADGELQTLGATTYSFNQPLMLPQVLAGRLKVRLPLAFLGDSFFANMAQLAMTQGWLILDNGIIEGEAVVGDGQLMLNGLPLMR
ncbi:DUF945 family protein [Gammaproteobacteria bacterium]|nr:DUF945 family protein [Gammaproteobacteria bacterium]